jgi:hypothetical protein
MRAISGVNLSVGVDYSVVVGAHGVIRGVHQMALRQRIRRKVRNIDAHPCRQQFEISPLSLDFTLDLCTNLRYQIDAK